jgi:hypothetical protein
MAWHDFEAFDLNAKFICLLVQQFAQAFFYFISEHLAAVLWAPDEVIRDVMRWYETV